MTNYIEPRSVAMLRVYVETHDAQRTAQAFNVSHQTVLSNYEKHLRDKKEIMQLASLEVIDWPNDYRDRNDKYQKTSTCIASEIAYIDKTILEIQDEQAMCRAMDKTYDMRGFEFCIEKMKRRRKNLLNKLYEINKKN